MQKKFFWVFLFFLFCLPHVALSQEKVPGVYFPQSFKDFGETVQNTTLTHSFVVENRGKATLVIEDIKSG